MFKKLLNKKIASSGTRTHWLEPTSPVWTAAYTKTQNHYNVSITGHKKLKKTR